MPHSEVIFGSYPQKKKNKPMPVTWRVLDERDGKALLISSALLDKAPYHKGKSGTWAESDLRRWLNGEFFSAAFDEKDRELIAETENENNAGGTTRDKVFLLSSDEAERYFADNKDRMAEKTTLQSSALSRLPFVTVAASSFFMRKRDRHSPWWLRSRGNYTEGAVVVNAGGGIHKDGYRVSAAIVGVRPCVWVRL
jgi:hypothetical protein